MDLSLFSGQNGDENDDLLNLYNTQLPTNEGNSQVKILKTRKNTVGKSKRKMYDRNWSERKENNKPIES